MTHENVDNEDTQDQQSTEEARGRVYALATVLHVECEIRLAELRGRNHPVLHTGEPGCPCCRCLLQKCTDFRIEHGLM